MRISRSVSVVSMLHAAIEFPVQPCHSEKLIARRPIAEIAEMNNARAISRKWIVPVFTMVPLPGQSDAGSGMKSVRPILKVVLVCDHVNADFMRRRCGVNGMVRPIQKFL